MPRRDGTGPMGQGSMTGRGPGRCNPEFSNLGSDYYGMGRRRGLSRGINSCRWNNKYQQDDVLSINEKISNIESKLNKLIQEAENQK